MTDRAVAVGRAATPPPPNAGSSSLGAALRLATLPRYALQEHILAIVRPALFAELEDRVGPVFPAVPGLAGESLRELSVRCLVVEEAALKGGPWAGVLEHHGAELRDELLELFDLARGSGTRVFWVRARPFSPAAAGADGEAEPTAGLPELPCPEGVLVAPGSAMGVGPEEGAAPTRLVSVLRSAALKDEGAAHGGRAEIDIRSRPATDAGPARG